MSAALNPAQAGGSTPRPALAHRLQGWRAQGWLRALDLAFVGLLQELDAELPDSLLLAAAWLANLEGRGHSCLPLGALRQDPQTTLAWPAEAAAELAAAARQLPADAMAARTAWAGRPVLQLQPADDSGSSPLVLHDDRLYLRRYWRFETRVARQVRARVQAAAGADFDSARARDLLKRLFAPPAPGAGPPVPSPNWQPVACALALRGRLTLVTGGPGTGKTYTAARLLVLLQTLHTGAQPLRTALAAPTGKAAARLRQSIVSALQDLAPQAGPDWPVATWAAALGPARTLHALLGTRPGTRRFVHDAAEPLELDLLLVDEASMVHLEMMDALLDALPPGARLVLLGDRHQLASVEAGAVMGELCRPPAAAPGTGQAGAAAGAAAAAPDDTPDRIPAYTAETRAWVQDLTGQTLPGAWPAAPKGGPGGVPKGAPAAAPAPGAPAGPPAARPGGTHALAQQTVVLQHSHRFDGPIGALAAAVNRGDGAAALATLHAAPQGPVALVAPADAAAVAALALQGRPGAPGGYRDYLQALAQRPSTDEAAAFDAWVRAVLTAFDRFRVLCALREGPWGVAGLNARIEQALVESGLLQRRGEWYEGRPVMVTRNDPALGVFNGDIGLVLRPAGAGPLRAWFQDGARLRSVAVGRLAEVETAFALTVHKSQGSEFAHVALVLPAQDAAVLTRELVYTGITRARQAFTLVTRDADTLARACQRLTRRLSGLRALLDEG